MKDNLNILELGLFLNIGIYRYKIFILIYDYIREYCKIDPMNLLIRYMVSRLLSVGSYYPSVEKSNQAETIILIEWFHI